MLLTRLLMRVTYAVIFLCRVVLFKPRKREVRRGGTASRRTVNHPPISSCIIAVGTLLSRCQHLNFGINSYICRRMCSQQTAVAPMYNLFFFCSAVIGVADVLPRPPRLRTEQPPRAVGALELPPPRRVQLLRAV